MLDCICQGVGWTGVDSRTRCTAVLHEGGSRGGKIGVGREGGGQEGEWRETRN